MKLRRLAVKIQYHFRAPQHLRQLAERLLLEADEADVAATEVKAPDAPTDADLGDAAAPDDLNDSLASGFRAFAGAILDKVFAGDLSWSDAKPKLDKALQAFEELTGTETGADGTDEESAAAAASGAIAESEQPRRAGGRRMAESLYGGSDADRAARGRAFLRSITGPG